MTEPQKKEKAPSFLDDLYSDDAAVKTPYIGIVCGPPSVGKTGLCMSGAPSPYFLPIEGGTDWITAPRLKDKKGVPYVPRTSDQLFEMAAFIYSKRKEFGYKTLVIDSLGFAQSLFYADIVRLNPQTSGKTPKKVTCIADLGNEGMVKAMAYWDRLITLANVFKNADINVIFVTHTMLVNMTTNDAKSYKEIDFALQSYGRASVAELIHRAADWCYYMDSEVKTATIGSGTWAKTVALGDETARTTITTRRTGLIKIAKVRAINEENIPDNYIYSRHERQKAAKKIFEDLDKV